MEDKNPYKNGGMFESASHIIFENAKHLRNTMTDAETVLWMHLKQKINGCKFRRQHPIGLFIADFYCHKAKLIIEVDGSIHNTEEVKKADAEKEAFFLTKNYRVLRFTNDQVLHKMESVIEKIAQVVNNNIVNTLRKSENKSPL